MQGTARALVCALALTVLVAGCGSDDDSGKTSAAKDSTASKPNKAFESGGGQERVGLQVNAKDGFTMVFDDPVIVGPAEDDAYHLDPTSTQLEIKISSREFKAPPGSYTILVRTDQGPLTGNMQTGGTGAAVTVRAAGGPPQQFVSDKRFQLDVPNVD